jgi:hypothetical protein
VRSACSQDSFEKSPQLLESLFLHSLPETRLSQIEVTGKYIIIMAIKHAET